MGAGEGLPVIASTGARRRSASAGWCRRAGKVWQRVLAHLIDDRLQRLGNGPLICALKCERERSGYCVSASHIAEVATAFCCAGYASGAPYTTNFAIPLLVPEEEELILLNRATERIAEVVAAKNRLVLVRVGVDAAGAGMEGVGKAVLRSLTSSEPVVSIQSIIAARVEDAAVPVVGSALSHDVDDAARRLAILRAVGVAKHLEFLNRFNRGIDENRAV